MEFIGKYNTFKSVKHNNEDIVSFSFNFDKYLEKYNIDLEDIYNIPYDENNSCYRVKIKDSSLNHIVSIIQNEFHYFEKEFLN